MSATCDKCEWGSNPAAGSPVLLCPLHAEAEAMRGLLRRLVGEWDERKGPHLIDVLGAVIAASRPILARIDGDTPDA